MIKRLRNRFIRIAMLSVTAVMLLLTVPALARGKLSRWQGIVLLVLYAGFCAFQFCM